MTQKLKIDGSGLACKICLNSEQNIEHVFEEKMFGTGQKFTYLECKKCGCLQLLEIPEDISEFYPRDYSNFKPVSYRKQSWLAAYLKKRKSEYLLGINMNLAGFLVSLLSNPGFVIKLKPARLKFQNKILDLGAGNGDRLLRLSYRGFTNLTGTDPFIDADIKFENGLVIYKMDLDNLHEQFDFIMLNHSFEHMPNPLEILQKLNKLIGVTNFVLIRIPVADSYAWRHYGKNWNGLDPPRHFFLHTRKSIDILADKAGFKLAHAIDDSLEFQFIGSEQLQKGIKSRDKDSYFVNRNNTLFSRKQIRRFKKLTVKLNKNGEGDTTCFYLIKEKDV